MIDLIPPYGGRLVDLRADGERAVELRQRAATLPSLTLSERSLCDLELLATGAFSPLDRFMCHDDHQRVVHDMRLLGGALFPLPVALPVNKDAAVTLDRDVALRGNAGELLAVMRIEEVFRADVRETARFVLGTEDDTHPFAKEMKEWSGLHASGALEVVALPPRHDFRHLRLTPAEVRTRLASCGSPNVVAFQTRNPLHRAHEELLARAARAVDGTALLHPAVGLTKPADVDHVTRVRTYEAVARAHQGDRPLLLSLVPLAMRMAGPREALWHALIRRNYGANHLVVGRDHAGPGSGADGRPFYGAYDAQHLVARHSGELGVKPVPFKELVYLPDQQRYEEREQAPPGARVWALSGSQVRDEFLKTGRPLPAWFTRPECAAILAEAHPPRHRQGFCVWLTGLSGAGKSTTAAVVIPLLMERGRRVTELDGDVVRTHLSRGLGFTRDDRDANVKRIGFVAREVVRHGGAVVCAAISPYRRTRDEVRTMVGRDQFVEVFVDTPLDVCEQRDVKGMYAAARAGRMQNLTGVDDPYEPPHAPDVRLDTVAFTAEENARSIIRWLEAAGFLVPGHSSTDACSSRDPERLSHRPLEPHLPGLQHEPARA